jgi:hypothetical protein
MEYDIFISHASEDKENVARPLAQALTFAGLKVWLDENELTIGDSLRRNIDKGLSNSKFGVVILSPHFFKKEWPQKELDGLVSRDDGKQKVILPIWHDVTANEVRQYSPPLADKLAGMTSLGIDRVAQQIINAINIDGRISIDKLNALSSSQNPSSIEPNIILDYQTLLHMVLNQAFDSIERDADISVFGVRTGLSSLDSLILGLHPTELSLIVSLQNIGKTSFLSHIGMYIASNEGLPVLAFSTDNAATDFLTRSVGSFANIPTRNLKLGLLTDEWWEQLTIAVEETTEIQFYISDETNLSVEKITEQALALHHKVGGLGLVIIDAIPLSVQMSNDSQLEKFFREIKLLATKIRCPILVSDRIYHAHDNRVDTRPLLSDYEKYPLINRYVDNVFFLHKPIHFDSLEDNSLEIIIAKQKAGSIGAVRVKYDAKTGRFASFDEQD